MSQKKTRKYTVTKLVKDRFKKLTKTERNNEIYKKYVVDKLSMREIAAEYGISNSRVGAIVSKIESQQ